MLCGPFALSNSLCVQPETRDARCSVSVRYAYLCDFFIHECMKSLELSVLTNDRDLFELDPWTKHWLFLQHQQNSKWVEWLRVSIIIQHPTICCHFSKRSFDLTPIDYQIFRSIYTCYLFIPKTPHCQSLRYIHTWRKHRQTNDICDTHHNVSELKLSKSQPK